jgi:hypothetical protein
LFFFRFIVVLFVINENNRNKIKQNNAKLFLFSENVSTFAMCDLRYYDYGARLKRTQKELLNLK